MQEFTQRYFLKLAYVGTNYHGWQKQPSSITVQELLEEAISKVLRVRTGVIGAGRTDTGVHARVFYAHFDAEHDFNSISNMQLQYKLNSMLPSDIAIERIMAVTPGAHARFSAISRTYNYYICTTKDPYMAAFSWLFERELNVQAMQEAAKQLLLYSDFSSFARSNTQVKTNNCTIHEASWVQEGHLTIFRITADRFLRNMVRAIVGTLIDVGLQKMSVTDFVQVIKSRSRGKAGLSAPACGLHLTGIKYPDNLFL